MIRVFSILAVFLVFAAGFAWLADNPGMVQFTWAGREIETSLMVFAVAFVAFIIILGIVWSVLRTIWRSPHMLKGYFSARRRDKGYNALSNGLVAVGEGDAKRAQKAAHDANKFLKDAPLALLLKAQAAQLAGEYETARKTFHSMLEGPETKLLGLRGLFMEAERTNDPSAALQLAISAMDEAAKHPARPNDGATVASWAGPAVLRYQSAAEDWDGALKTISANNSAGLIDRKEVKRRRAVVLVAKALAHEDREPQEAKIAALEAHKLAPELVPAAVVAGRVLSRLGELRRAVKTLEGTWKLHPHPDLAETYAHVRPGDSPRDRVKRIKTLTRLSPDHLESAIALAKASIEAQDWDGARAALRPHLTMPTQRACLLMADIEEGEHGDKGRVREWLSKAVHAAADPVWIADGVISDHWAPVSPVSGQLDAYEWKVPPTALAKPTVIISENDVLLAPLEIEPPKPEPAPEPKPEPKPEAKPEPAAKPEAVKAAAAPVKASQETGNSEKGQQTSPETSRQSEENAETNAATLVNDQPAASPAAAQKELPVEKVASVPQVTASGPASKTESKTESKTGKADEANAKSGPNFLSPEAMPPVPDDPGPSDEEENNKRFKLF
uniref:heme biosynthesis protein HemY n=1 Tax=Pararhizobium sp. IMCC3301 TaxID=3067904 RepID=UPI002741640D|nr:heme biosynthesis HemY N-terminal domain-containing protein [Pararhizobium sp. IMCC3301]